MRLAVKETIEEHVLKLQKQRQNLFQAMNDQEEEEEQQLISLDHHPEIDPGGSMAATTLPIQAKNETLSQNEVNSLFNAVLQH